MHKRNFLKLKQNQKQDYNISISLTMKPLRIKTNILLERKIKIQEVLNII